MSLVKWCDSTVHISPGSAGFFVLFSVSQGTLWKAVRWECPRVATEAGFQPEDFSFLILSSDVRCAAFIVWVTVRVTVFGALAAFWSEPCKVCRGSVVKAPKRYGHLTQSRNCSRTPAELQGLLWCVQWAGASRQVSLRFPAMARGYCGGDVRKCSKVTWT